MTQRTPKKSAKPSELGKKMEFLHLGRSLGRSTAGMLLEMDGNKTPAATLDERERMLGQLIYSDKPTPLSNIYEKADVDLFMKACIRTGQFEKVADFLAGTIRQRNYGIDKADAFLYFYLDHVKSRPAAEPTTLSEALELSNQFQKKADKILKGAKNVRLNPFEQNQILAAAFRMNHQQKVPADVAFEFLAHNYLAQAERSPQVLASLIDELAPYN